jgi:hypothetical protein
MRIWMAKTVLDPLLPLMVHAINRSLMTGTVPEMDFAIFYVCLQWTLFVVCLNIKVYLLLTTSKCVKS